MLSTRSVASQRFGQLVFRRFFVKTEFKMGEFHVKCQLPVHMIFPRLLGDLVVTLSLFHLVTLYFGFQSSQGNFHVKYQLPIQITGISHDKSFVYIEKRGKTRASGKFPVKCQLSIQVTGISHEISPQHNFLSVLVARGKFMWRGKIM